MRTMWRTLVHLSLALILAAGAMVALPGCERKKDVGDQLNNAADDLGNAAEKAGDKAKDAL